MSRHTITAQMAHRGYPVELRMTYSAVAYRGEPLQLTLINAVLTDDGGSNPTAGEIAAMGQAWLDREGYEIACAGRCAVKAADNDRREGRAS